MENIWLIKTFSDILYNNNVRIFVSKNVLNLNVPYTPSLTSTIHETLHYCVYTKKI